MNSSQGFPRLALFLCGCAAFLNLYTTQGIFDELAASFHISAHQSNWSITATTLAVALAAPFVYRLSGGRERSRVIAFAASLLCVPMLLAAHAGSFAAFLLWRFAEGMLIPLLFASSVAYIGERWSGGAVIELTSLYVAGTILGGFAGRFLTGLLTEEWDWRVAFRILAGLTLLIAVAIRALLPANSGRHSPAPGKRPLVSRELFRAPLLSSYAVGFCVLFSQVAMFTYIGIHLSRPPYSLDTAQLGSIYAVFLLALLVIPASGRAGPRPPAPPVAAGRIAAGRLRLAADPGAGPADDSRRPGSQRHRRVPRTVHGQRFHRQQRRDRQGRRRRPLPDLLLRRRQPRRGAAGAILGPLGLAGLPGPDPPGPVAAVAADPLRLVRTTGRTRGPARVARKTVTIARTTRTDRRLAMNHVITPHSKLLGVIEPVLNDMPAGTLRHALFRAFWDETASLLDIEDAFARVTARRQAVEPLRKFFASWSKTNNSAASVSGLANRLTLLARSEQGSAAADQLYRACGSLQRITDEDLGALGNTVHADLFYTMATTLCGDDRWLLRENCLPSAQAFKDWTDRQRLRERDLMQGLLTTLVHEVYTHGEVEYIHPLYKEWFSRDMGVPAERARATVAWVTVHTGGTESNHFAHATAAVNAFVEAMEIEVNEEAARNLFGLYLRNKAQVMRDCAALF